ncbi:MAG: SDR family oxidoreductase [Anaerolineaceae bacterium]|nr:SDR family oxidoreductase [Anaerolineaceae bacterium]
MPELFRLDGKTALVTGCRRGIGRAIALTLAEAGADLIGVSQNMEGDGGAIGAETRALGRNFHAFRGDMGDRNALYAFIRDAQATAPPVDILVNNAGIVPRGDAVDFPDEQWDRVLETNLSAWFILAREFGRGMLARGNGKIIFIASLMSFQGGIRVPAYAASKGAIARLTQALSNEWAGQGVQVNAIAPGYVATELTVDLQNDAARYHAILERIPAGRWARPDDFRGAALYLASPASDYVTGEILTVDGGWMGR